MQFWSADAGKLRGQIIIMMMITVLIQNLDIAQAVGSGGVESSRVEGGPNFTHYKKRTPAALTPVPVHTGRPIGHETCPLSL